MAKPKPRKWSNLKLPAPPVEPEMSERFKKVLAEVDKRRWKSGDTPGVSLPVTMDDLSREWAELEAADARAAAESAERGIKYDALEMRILEELKKVQELAGTDIWRGRGQTFSPKHTVCPIVRDKAALKKWIEDTRQTDLLTLAGPTLKSLTCALLERAESMTPAERAQLKGVPGEPGMPPPGVEVYLRPGVNRTSQNATPIAPGEPRTEE